VTLPVLNKLGIQCPATTQQAARVVWRWYSKFYAMQPLVCRLPTGDACKSSRSCIPYLLHVLPPFRLLQGLLSDLCVLRLAGIAGHLFWRHGDQILPCRQLLIIARPNSSLCMRQQEQVGIMAIGQSSAHAPILLGIVKDDKTGDTVCFRQTIMFAYRVEALPVTSPARTRLRRSGFLGSLMLNDRLRLFVL